MKHPLEACRRLPAASLLNAALVAALAGCASPPLLPFSTDTPPLVLVPAAQAGVKDQRARFRETYCAVLQARAGDVPDHRRCDDALTRIGTEPAGSGQPVALGASSRRLVAAVVPGIGYDCFAQWLQPAGSAAAHVAQYGYEQRLIKVDAISSSRLNGRQIRDAVMAMDLGPGAPRLVLVGYSKGTPDILEAIVDHPEIRSVEVQFTEQIEHLQLGQGANFHGQGILAITKALLQSGVAYIGGYLRINPFA